MPRRVDTAEKILAFLTANTGTYYSRSEIEKALGSDKSVAAHIRKLRTADKIGDNGGQKRAMKYGVKASATPAT